MSSPARFRRHRDRALQQLDSFARIAAEREILELRREAVSRWSVGQHLRHLVLAAEGILGLLEKAEPKASLAGQGPNLIGRCVLWLGFIPRGRGKAPDYLDPLEPDLEGLPSDLERIRQRFAALDADALAIDQALARHFAFGALDPAQWLRFVVVHQHHHAKIIREVRRAS